MKKGSPGDGKRRRSGRYSRKRWGALAFAIIVVGAVSVGVFLPWRYDHGMGLWRAIERCSRTTDHRPCALYDAEAGYVLFKDREGVGQYLLMPSRRLRGIEEEALLHPDTPNYLQLAWEKRQVVEKAYGHFLPDERLSLAINSRRGRSQEQLHIHLDCLRSDVRQTLALLPEGAEGHVKLVGHDYRWWRLTSLQPAPLLAVPFFPTGAEEGERSRYGLAVVALHGQFLLLQNRAHGLDWGHAEELQDHACRQ